MKTFTRKKRLDVFIRAELRDYISEEAARTGKHLNTITDELLSQVISYRRQETLEEHSLPVLRELFRREVDRATAQLLTDVRETLLTEVVDVLREDIETSKHRLVVLLVRLLRETGIARHLIYALATRLTDVSFAAQALEEANEKTEKYVVKKQKKEESA
jgi:hypothetical protein